MKKTSYPNDDTSMLRPVRDTNKWLQTVKDIYSKTQNEGLDRKDAIKSATKNWSPTEVYDFLNWLKFYEEGSHMKYKIAQSWYENGNPGYFLPIKNEAPQHKQVYVDGDDISHAKEEVKSEMSPQVRKDLIEKQRHKIIGRLDSTEKLLRSHEGQLFAGKEFESLIEAIYSLKKKIQLVNKITLSTKSYDDMIIREGNVLNRNGFVKAAQVLYKLADEAPATDTTPPTEEGLQGLTEGLNDSSSPPVPSPTAPTEGGTTGDMSGVNIPGNTPLLGPNDGPGSGENGKVVPKGISKFLENLDADGVFSDDDDELEVVDNNSSSDFVVDEEDTLEVEDRNGILIAEAQDASLPESTPEVSSDLQKEKPQVSSSTPQKGAPNTAVGNPNDNPNGISDKARQYDDIIDMAFKDLTVEDIIGKVEDLAKIFSTREVPRQLFILDLMMNRLGLASYFPSLSEAINKSIDSNNYISSRIDDILSKLRGNVKTNDIDLRNGGGAVNDSPELQSIKQNLQTNQEKEKAKKEMRKKQEDEAFELDSNKETPDVEIAEDLQPEITPTPPVTTPKVNTPPTV